MIDSLNLTNPIALIIAIIIFLFMVFEVINGYKKGFLEKGIILVGSILIIIGSYLLKDPLAVFLYTHFPFFKFDGIFKGVTALNIILYEVIAFVIVFVVLFILFKIVCLLTKIVDRILSLIFFIGIPNKILGALLGFIQGIVILYFIIAIFKIGTNIMGYEMQPSLADYIVDIPILKNTFGSSLESLDEITSLAKDYEYTKDKEQFNKEAFDILLKYNVISEENLNILIDKGKIKIDDNTGGDSNVEETNE
ncbi:MAG: CvpA family protein [Candidatus Coprovivens sp.]